MLMLITLVHQMAIGQVASDSVRVVNAGVNGNNSANLLSRLDKDVLLKHPDLVVLMAGTNDMLHTNKSLSIPDFEKNYQELITRISNKADLVLLTIAPIHSPYVLRRKPQFNMDPGGPQARIDSANSVIRSLAAANHCILLDLNRILTACGGANTDKEGLFQNEVNSGIADGVHPNANGYKVIATAVYLTIIKEKPGSRTIVCFGDSITSGYRMEGQGTTRGDTYPAFLLKMLNP